MNVHPLFRVSRTYDAQAHDDEWVSRKNRIWVFIALAVAFFVRVRELNAQSLWNDEGTSVALAQRSIAAILNAAAQDIHPPLYYLLLSGWVAVAGIGEFAVRFLSVLAGVLVVALTFRIAREFFDQDVAVIAAVLSALNPFQVYYAQETRMYIWVTLFAAVSVWAMVVVFKPPRENAPPLRKRIHRRIVFLLLYVLFTLAALYTNYYAFTVVVFQNLAFLAWLVWARRTRRPRIGHSLVFWGIAQVVIVLAYLPWLNLARQSLTSWPGISEPLSLPELVWRIVSAFATGADAPLDFQIYLIAAYLLLFIGGLLPSRDLFKQSAWGIVTCALWALVPLLAMYFVSLSRPAYNPKFLLLATPGFIILAGRGVSVLYPGLFLRERAPYGSFNEPRSKRLARQYINTAKLLVGALFAAGAILALQNMYSDPRLQRDDYRSIVNYINAVSTDRDAVIVNAPGQLDVVRYYFKSAAVLVGLPIGRPMQREATQNVLNDLATRENMYGIFWATEQSDPDRYIERQLAATAFQAGDDWHGNVRLAQYAMPTGSWETTQLGANFGDEILLQSYKHPAGTKANGNVVPIELEWRPLKLPPTARYKIFAQLLDAQGRLVSQRDTEPQDGFMPTHQWTRDETIVDKLAIPIPPGIAPGTYQVIVGLYRGDTGERLPVQSSVTGTKGDFVSLGEVELDKKIYPREAFRITRALSGNAGAVDLIGYQMERFQFERGELIPLVLYFQAREKPANDSKFSVELRDQGENVVASAVAFENYPTLQWDASEIVRDVHTLPVPPDALTGEYRLVVTDGTYNFEVTRVQVR